MTDIVERLRQGVGMNDAEDVMDAERAMDKAADEIERLRADLQMRGKRAFERAFERKQLIGELEAELERLLALLRAIMDDTSDGQESMSFDIRDRIERALEPKP